MLTTADLVQLTLVIAFGFLFAVVFYQSLSTRDVLVARVQLLSRRASKETWFTAFTYALTVFVGIPFLVVIWSVVLELILLIVGSVEIVDNVAIIAISVVGAARILAYVHEEASHELAKAIPLAAGFLLLTGGPIDLEAKAARLQQVDGTDLTDEMLGFLIVLEIGLRLMTDGTHAALAYYRRRRGEKSNLGFWQTLWQGAKRRFALDPALVSAPGENTKDKAEPTAGEGG